MEHANATLPHTRLEARSQGSRLYWGLQCEAHPGSPRYTANARCVACAKLDRQARGKANPAYDAARKRLARARLAAERAATVAPQFADLLG